MSVTASKQLEELVQSVMRQSGPEGCILRMWSYDFGLSFNDLVSLGDQLWPEKVFDDGFAGHLINRPEIFSHPLVEYVTTGYRLAGDLRQLVRARFQAEQPETYARLMTLLAEREDGPIARFSRELWLARARRAVTQLELGPERVAAAQAELVGLVDTAPDKDCRTWLNRLIAAHTGS